MAFITNGGAKLIQRAVQENKALVFGSIRMNTIYESNPSELVQKSDSWFGQNVGEVVGCLSHVSVDDASCVCDSKLAIQCNDNSKPWKSIGIYAHLEDESGEILIACESIQNGDYKNVTIVELPVTLDGAVEDFGLSEGGGGGGGDVPANMMTTDTIQDVSGDKRWQRSYYISEGGGTLEEPQPGDRKADITISLVDDFNRIGLSRQMSLYDGSGWTPGMSGDGSLSNDALVLDDGDSVEGRIFVQGGHVEITTNHVRSALEDGGYESATWHNIIEAANGGGGGGGSADISSQDDVVQDDGEGGLSIFGELIQPDYSMSVDGLLFNFDSSGYLASVSSYDSIATISVLVVGVSGAPVSNGRVNGLSRDANSPLVFSSPIQLQEGYHVIYQVIRSVV